MSSERMCWYRYRFQPVVGVWGHMGLDYTFENPVEGNGADAFLLRHVDYGLPGDAEQPGYRFSIALFCALVSPAGRDWPPLSTPFGRVFRVSPFTAAPREIGDFLRAGLPRFWGPAGAYRMMGPNSNTGLRLAVEACEAATGFRLARPPLWMRLGGFGWNWRGKLAASHGPYPGYADERRFGWSASGTL